MEVWKIHRFLICILLFISGAVVSNTPAPAAVPEKPKEEEVDALEGGMVIKRTKHQQIIVILCRICLVVVEEEETINL